MKSVRGDLHTIRFGVFELDPSAGELRKQGVKVRLQEQPLRVLELLLEKPGRMITRDELRRELWPENSLVDFDHGLNRAINKRCRNSRPDCFVYFRGIYLYPLTIVGGGRDAPAVWRLGR
jgi:DNA-binding response OmpR family regulator